MNGLEQRLLSELICGNAEHGTGAALAKANEGKFHSFNVPSPYRSEYEIKRFFADADLYSAEEVEKLYSGAKGPTTSRQQITLRLLEPICASKDGNLSPAAERLVLALADPRSYTSAALHSEALSYLNDKLLSFYDKQVELKNGVRPVLAGLRIDTAAQTGSLDYKLPSFADVTCDASLAHLLEQRWEEMVVCSQAGAFLASTVLLGSIFEGLLKDRVIAEIEKARTSTRMRGVPTPPEHWSLEQLIQACVDVGWISREREAYLDAARQMRNLIHPQIFLKQKNSSLPNKGTVRMGIAVICSAVEDLSRNG